MRSNCSKWGSKCRVGRLRQHRALRLRQQVDGSVNAVQQTAGSSVKTAVSLALRRKKVGFAAAVQSIRGNSVWNAGNPARQELLFIDAINAAGSRQIRIIRLNSARNAAMYLMMAMNRNSKFVEKSVAAKLLRPFL